MNSNERGTEKSAAERREARYRKLEHFRAARVNLGSGERRASAICGGALVLEAVRRRKVGGALLGLVGAGFLCRGITGRSAIYRALGVTAGEGPPTSNPLRREVRASATVTIPKTPQQLYRALSDRETLSSFLNAMERVEKLGSRRSHWLARAGGRELGWVAEITADREGELITWRSLPGCRLHHRGQLKFTPQGDWQTRVELEVIYRPAGGVLGQALAMVTGRDPRSEVRETLRRFKEFLETGGTADRRGPSGHS